MSLDGEYRAGDRVRIIDGSEAHGDCGVVWQIMSDGTHLVEIDGEDVLWPCRQWDMEPV